MGWSWAVHLIQAAHTHQLSAAAPDSPWVVDKRPSSPVSGDSVAKVLYIDNFAAIGNDGDRLTEVVTEVQDILARREVVSHLDPFNPSGGTFLGYELLGNRGRWRPTREKFWRLTLALRLVIGIRARVIGREIEKLVGHCIATLLRIAPGAAVHLQRPLPFHLGLL